MEELLQAVQALRDQANAMLAGLPPLEQFEASQELSYGLRSLTTYAKDLIQFTNEGMQKVQATVSKLKSDATVKAEAEAEQKLLGAGTHILKTDSDAAVQAAVSQTETDTRAAIVAERQATERITTRREKLVTDKALPRVAAEKIPDGAFATEEGLTAHVAEVSGRLKRLTDLGLTAEKAGKVVAEIAEIGIDDAGKALATSRIDVIEESVRTVRGHITVNPLLGLGGGGAGVLAEGAPATAAIYF